MGGGGGGGGGSYGGCLNWWGDWPFLLQLGQLASIELRSHFVYTGVWVYLQVLCTHVEAPLVTVTFVHLVKGDLLGETGWLSTTHSLMWGL